jgi:hypothetical protein
MSTTHSSEPMTASELTQNTMLSDILEQRSLLIGVGVTLAALWFFMSRRPAREEQAARRLVRDWRKVDDIDDARDLLGSNVPPILRPALLIVLEEVERQIKHGFRRVERSIQHL